jgi:hypothetical protein
MENKTYRPVVFSDWCKAEYFADFNWQVSIHVDSFNFADRTPYKVFLQMEPPEIRNIEQKIIDNSGFYDLILTWNHVILGYCGNAVLFPFGGCWTREADTSKKEFAASFLTSSKVMCPGHGLRLDIFNRLANRVGAIPVTKHKSPPMLADKRSMLVPFQFSVAMENTRRQNFFTEKLIDCFATKTIPIYWGCPNVDEFFNPEGIIKFNNADDLEAGLAALTPETYASRRAAIEDNYNRSLLYSNFGARVHTAINDVWEHPEKIGGWRIR